MATYYRSDGKRLPAAYAGKRGTGGYVLRDRRKGWLYIALGAALLVLGSAGAYVGERWLATGGLGVF